MEWKEIGSPEWHDPIVCYPSEGIHAQDDKIRNIVIENRKSLNDEEVDMIVESVLSGSEDFDGPLTVSMITKAMSAYRIQKKSQEYGNELS